MNKNYYSFDFFEELSKGKLHDELISNLNRNEILQKINSKNEQCIIFSIVKFIKTNGSLRIESRFDIPKTHPLAFDFIDNQIELFPVSSKNVDECIKLLNILPDNLLGLEQKKIKNKLHYNFKHLSSWESIGSNQLKLHFYYSIIQEQKNIVIKIIKEKIINLNDKKAVCDYFRILLKELDLICIEILRKHKLEIETIKYENKNQFENIDLIKLIYLSLDEIHTFVEERFDSHLNDNRLITNISTKLKGIELVEKSSQIKSFFLKTKIKQELRKIIFIPFYDFELKESKNDISDDFFTYYSFYIYQMEEFITKNDNPNIFTEDMMIDFLFEINFNCNIFVDFIAAKIKLSIDKEKNDIQKKIILLTYLKRFQQKLISTKKKYFLSELSIRELITKWIEYELSFFNQVKEVQLNNSQIAQSLESNNIKTRLNTNLSVNESALLIRLLKKNGIFKEENTNKLLISLSETFLTSTLKEISFKSLRNKFYNIDPITIQALEKRLINMLEDCKEFY